MKAFSMHRFVGIFRCECEYERDPQYETVIHLWEPLYPYEPLTEKDRPQWDDTSVTFYRPEQKDWVRVNRHLMFSSRGLSPDVVVLPDGLCVEITGAQIVWRAEHQRWFIRWQGYTHSRMAILARAGLDAWRNAP